MKIVLLGFDFVCPNKGCEALSYSFLNILRKYCIDKDVNIYNITYKDCLGEIPSMYPEFKFVNWRIHFKSPLYLIKTIKLFKDADLIFDITYGDSFSDIYGKTWLVKTNIHKYLAEKVNRNLILLPQTYGPFNNTKLKKWSMDIIKKSKKIYSRDETSIQYLKKYNIVGCELTTDLAMALPYNRAQYECIINKQYINIGLNVSSLLWENGFTGENEFGLKVDYREYCQKIVEELLFKGYKVHLIPHVIDFSENAPENDWRAIRELKEKCPQAIIPPQFNNPIDIKSYISNMDVFIGARMHSTIAAFSSLVPVIPFSYSRKFEGLFNNLNYPYIISGRNISTQEAIENTLKWVDERNLLLEVEKQGMDKVSNLLKNFTFSLKKYLC